MCSTASPRIAVIHNGCSCAQYSADRHACFIRYMFGPSNPKTRNYTGPSRTSRYTSPALPQLKVATSKTASITSRESAAGAAHLCGTASSRIVVMHTGCSSALSSAGARQHCTTARTPVRAASVRTASARTTVTQTHALNAGSCAWVDSADRSSRTSRARQEAKPRGSGKSSGVRSECAAGGAAPALRTAPALKTEPLHVE